MNIHDAIEQAYKNGYKKGEKDFADKLKRKIGDNNSILAIVFTYVIDDLIKGGEES